MAQLDQKNLTAQLIMMRLILFRGMKEAAHTGTDWLLCMARDRSRGRALA